MKALDRKEHGRLPLVQANSKFNLALLSGASDFQCKDEVEFTWLTHQVLPLFGNPC